jgi:hypothetical protein
VSFVIARLLILYTASSCLAFPYDGIKVGVIFLLFTLVTTSFAIVGKHRELYRQGKITRPPFIRNGALEILGFLVRQTWGRLVKET